MRLRVLRKPIKILICKFLTPHTEPITNLCNKMNPRMYEWVIDLPHRACGGYCSFNTKHFPHARVPYEGGDEGGVRK